MKTLYTKLKIPKTTGQDTIAKATSLFYWIDGDFKNYGTDKPENKKPASELAVLEMDRDATFAQMFTHPEEMALSQSQIIEFIQKHRDTLRKDGYATFFLFKVEDQFFVAYVRVGSGGLGVSVRRFELDRVWPAEDSLRLVVPQLALKYFEQTFELLDISALPSELMINGIKYTRND